MSRIQSKHNSSTGSSPIDPTPIIDCRDLGDRHSYLNPARFNHQIDSGDSVG